jgi:hypothetical protein
MTRGGHNTAKEEKNKGGEKEEEAAIREVWVICR